MSDGMSYVLWLVLRPMACPMSCGLSHVLWPVLCPMAQPFVRARVRQNCCVQARVRAGHLFVFGERCSLPSLQNVLMTLRDNVFGERDKNAGDQRDAEHGLLYVGLVMA